MHKPDYYHALRAKFTPDEVKRVLLFESPPISGRYFYDPSGKTTETLFSAVMRVFDFEPKTKAEGLAMLRDAGVVLLDATYQQINDPALTNADRVRIMREDYPALMARLPAAPILIGMARVLDAVGDKLIADGFEVMNNGRRIPFPSNGHQRRFQQEMTAALEER